MQGSVYWKKMEGIGHDKNLPRPKEQSNLMPVELNLVLVQHHWHNSFKNERRATRLTAVQPTLNRFWTDSGTWYDMI
jgi:hypothetical protein